MGEERLKQILNNVLAEVAKASEMDTATYLAWLKMEVGVTNQELIILQEEGFLPIPVEQIER